MAAGVRSEEEQKSTFSVFVPLLHFTLARRFLSFSLVLLSLSLLCLSLFSIMPSHAAMVPVTVEFW